MNDRLMSCSEVTEYLGITLNNLRQIQHRGTIKWVERKGKEVFYSHLEVMAYKAKREGRKQA